ncbi:MAG TPA: phosphoribosylaminoimidazolesuccinocarboxamide synthase [Candidatus Woesebacteria bacterium]|nr:phosphoribosylaminoimidazolesuccinocarboxamide synthase [Candidatus Woesebacteria bacterium]
MISEKTIIKAIPKVLKTVDLPGLGPKYQGKVRDFYIKGDRRIIITTDRQSAFDVNLGFVPFKGAVLNQLAAFWFKKTKKIIRNHVIKIPHPNVLIAENCRAIPVEMVIRGYLTGVTETSIWSFYQKGERVIYGIKFPNGMVKNQQLSVPVITPTSHGGAAGHDERLTRDEIIKRKIVPEKLYQQMEKATYALFKFGSELARKRGIILVDTKYEFGLDKKGRLTLIDEIHTPDSSRFWRAETYKERFKQGLEPENFDKEFLRLWYAERGYKGGGQPPQMSRQLMVDLSRRYLTIYEKLTGKKFKAYRYPVEEAIRRACLDIKM